MDQNPDLEDLFRLMREDGTYRGTYGLIDLMARTMSKMLLALGVHEAAKLMRPAPEGYKYVVQIVKVLEDTKESPPAVDPYDPVIAARLGARDAADAALDPDFLRTRAAWNMARIAEQVVAKNAAPEPVLIPFDPTKKYEYKGLSCDIHAQQAHRRERNATGPWTCTVCMPGEEAP
jgi:hypothetical protein